MDIKKSYTQVDKAHRNLEIISIITKKKGKNSLDLNFFHKF